MLLDLTKMKPGSSGIIKSFEGGCGVELRLQSMGLRPGKKIRKVSSHFWRGPQTVEIDSARFAIGFGMAKRIFIEIQP